MHVQLVTFQLNGITDEQYREAGEAGAATFAALPGLLSKIWLRDPQSKTYGGLYLWRDRESFEAYVAGDVFKAVTQDRSLADLRSQDFEVLERITKATQPGLAVV